MECSEELPLTLLISSQEPFHSLISQSDGLVQSFRALLHFLSCVLGAGHYRLSFFTSLRNEGKKKYERFASLREEEMRRNSCQLRGTMGDTLFMDIFNSDILYADAPHILSIEQWLLKRHQGAKVLKHKLMKWNSSLWHQRSGNKMLTVLWSLESSQAVDDAIVSGWLGYLITVGIQASEWKRPEMYRVLQGCVVFYKAVNIELSSVDEFWLYEKISVAKTGIMVIFKP